jgi:transposase
VPATQLLSLPSGLALTDCFVSRDLIIVAVASTAASSQCPTCACPSDRIHSRYRRTLADSPHGDRRLVLRLTVRKFSCRNPDCPRVLFCERLPELAAPYARSSNRLTQAHQVLGFALGGEAGARLAEVLAMPTSPDTLLRRVKCYQGAPSAEPRYVGVDDWAWRKGQNYGTILIDLERGRVLDLLPGRDGEALKVWLQQHPSVEVITRDRWASYAQAATEGAPQARQIADRWHLLKNLREAVERLLGRFAPQVHAALAVAPEAGSPPDEAPARPATPTAPATPTGRSTAAAESRPDEGEPAEPSLKEQTRQAKRQRRVDRHREVRNLRTEGLSVRRVARLTGLSIRTVLRYGREDQCPDWHTGRVRPNLLAGFTETIEDWLAAGNRNAAALHRQLQERGCRAGYDAVRRLVNQRLGSGGKLGPRAESTRPLPVAPPSGRQLSFEFIKRPEKRKAEEQGRLDRLQKTDTTLEQALDLAGEFAAMIRKSSSVSLTEWLAKAAQSCSAEIRNFATGLSQDAAAVQAALTEPWSNGPVEGQVNRLKLIKRQMYGRAGFSLLRARVRFGA